MRGAYRRSASVDRERSDRDPVSLAAEDRREAGVQVVAVGNGPAEDPAAAVGRLMHVQTLTGADVAQERPEDHPAAVDLWAREAELEDVCGCRIGHRHAS